MRGIALHRGRAGLLGTVLAALALAGCATTNSAVIVSGKTLTIYASRPPAGAGGQAATDVLDAEQLAFSQTSGQVTDFKLHLTTLDGRELSANARKAVQDNTAIAYLGEIQPGTSQDSVPITNELGLLEISPTDTGVYLTHSSPAVGGSPGTFYPQSSTYHQTFARVVPDSAAEATALVSAMHTAGVTKLYVASDGSDYGVSLADEVKSDASSDGLALASSASGADGIFYGATAGAAAAKRLDALAGESATAKLYGPSGLYDDTFVAGLSASAQARLYVSSPGFMPSALPSAGRQFDSSFESAYGHAPAPEAIFGYEAMSALIAVLQSEKTAANNRADVVSAFRTLKNRSSALGTYSLVGGDTSIAPFVLARAQNGALVVKHAIGS